ncbi:hypothetical protein H8356DRAFT_1641919 [Neocallimastix lanati (nom. inval.)]|jgi:hypothetical protein|nr:hypothetical protein H8356DRAFT_1641919 [Neocallimastix sp. JGI-2020a]
MNVDLNWCPCGKQSREDSMYCSDACYLKDLATNNNANANATTFNEFSRPGKNFEKDSFFTSFNRTAIYPHYHNDKRSNTLKVPDFNNYNKNPYDNYILSASSNLAFKNRQKYQQNSYYNYYYNSNNNNNNSNNNNYYISMNFNKNSNAMASSYSSNGSTIDDYFKKSLKIENSPKPSTVTIAPKENEHENAKKEKSEGNRSYSGRSSYIIEAVYPVQNFNGKNSIAVY